MIFIYLLGHSLRLHPCSGRDRPGAPAVRRRQQMSEARAYLRVRPARTLRCRMLLARMVAVDQAVVLVGASESSHLDQWVLLNNTISDARATVNAGEGRCVRRPTSCARPSS